MDISDPAYPVLVVRGDGSGTYVGTRADREAETVIWLSNANAESTANAKDEPA